MIRVAVGMVVNESGLILVQKRKLDCPLYPGWLEFPGGKCNKGESQVAALRREMLEEVALSVHRSQPLLKASYKPAEDQELHVTFHLVTDWSGKIAGMEGQEISWVGADVLLRGQMPPLNHAALYLLRTESAARLGVRLA